MTKAQIELYAALRVAVPLRWRIYGRSSGPDTPPHQESITVYFERPDHVGPGNSYLATELRALIVPRPLLEDPLHTRVAILHAVRAARDMCGSAEIPRVVGVSIDGRKIGTWRRWL